MKRGSHVSGAAALERVGVGGLRGAQVRRVDRAVRLQHLGVPDTDRRTRRAAYREPHPAHHVLAQVEDEGAFGFLLDRHRPQVRHLAHARPDLRDERHDPQRLDLGRLPAPVVEARLGPAGRLQPGVVVLAHQQVLRHDRARGGLPGAVAEDAHGGPVRELQLELHERAGRAAPVLPAPARHVPGVPAVAKDGRDGVLSLLHERRHVVRLVLEAVAVVGPARPQQVARGRLAVDEQRVEALRARVDSGAAHCLRHAELPAQVGGGTRGGRLPAPDLPEVLRCL